MFTSFETGLIQYGKAFMKRVDLSQQGGNS